MSPAALGSFSMTLKSMLPGKESLMSAARSPSCACIYRPWRRRAFIIIVFRMVAVRRETNMLTIRPAGGHRPCAVPKCLPLAARVCGICSAEISKTLVHACSAKFSMATLKPLANDKLRDSTSCRPSSHRVSGRQWPAEQKCGMKEMTGVASSRKNALFA